MVIVKILTVVVVTETRVLQQQGQELFPAEADVHVNGNNDRTRGWRKREHKVERRRHRL